MQAHPRIRFSWRLLISSAFQNANSEDTHDLICADTLTAACLRLLCHASQSTEGSKTFGSPQLDYVYTPAIQRYITMNAVSSSSSSDPGAADMSAASVSHSHGSSCRCCWLCPWLQRELHRSDNV